MAVTVLPGFAQALPGIVLGAASIAVVSSLDVLISAKIIENLTGRRGNGTQELISIGAANLVTPLMGGISGSISLATTTTAVRGGATNALALFFHGLLFLFLVPLIATVIGFLPRVVIGALVFYAGFQLFDRWTLELVKRVTHRKTVNWRSIAVDLAIIGIVAAVSLSGEIIVAVLIGVSVSIVVFMLRMSRNVIRRERFGAPRLARARDPRPRARGPALLRLRGAPPQPHRHRDLHGRAVRDPGHEPRERARQHRGAHPAAGPRAPQGREMPDGHVRRGQARGALRARHRPRHRRGADARPDVR
jgi:MFS superfamily sulfate permease-like transporter